MAETKPEHPLLIQAQYIKDLSFENPNAPGIYAALAQQAPQVSINLDVASSQVGERAFEVVLRVRVNADLAGKAAFLIELDYAALVTVGAAVPAAEIEPLLLRETPRLLYPFARNTLAEVTRDGGFPSLVINPIDFDQFYRRHKRGKADGAAAQDTAASGQ